jgi:hypothetical protein
LIYIQFTGKGWLTYALAPLTIAAGLVLGAIATRVSQDRYVGAGVAAVAIAAVGAAVQWLVGRRLNGAREPWEPAQHTTYGIPMEMTAPFYPAIGGLALSIVVGQATSPVWGWLLFLATAIPVGLLIRAARRRQASDP